MAAENTLGRRWPEAINKLEAFGVSKIGDFDLATFRKEVAGVKFNNLDGAPATVQSGSRQSAYYLRDKKQVYISDELPAEAAASIPQLELHESLGALGYNDHNYAISTALTTLSNMNPNAQRDRLQQAYGRGIFSKDNLRIKEGGTSVSGGGDLTTLYIKNQVLKLILGGTQNVNAISDDFLTRYPSIDFEPLPDPTLTQVYILYAYDIHRRQESFSVYVPMARWNLTSSRSDLLQEIARKVTEIFPTGSGKNLRSFRPSECRSGQTVTYPTPRDYATASIQDLRANLQLGCMKFMDGQTGVSTLAPTLDRQQEPKEAGYFSFTCDFHYGAASISYQLNAPAGKRSMNSKMWGVGTDSVDGTASVSPEGSIEFTMISVFPNEGPTRHSPVLKSQSPDFGKSEIQEQGRTLSFECRKSR